MSQALLPLQLQGLLDTGIVVGDGSYATVKQLDFRGLKCVGKKLHDLLYQLANPRDKATMLERFAGECELLSRLHHPCIVQFIGVYFEQDSQLPVLVMEYLHTNLSSCLEEYGILPVVISYPILRDVALGLRYLHENSPPIIHRDLSANNVLLTADMNAKISDLGVAKILNLSPAQITQRISTQAPGTPCYMPPEALISKPAYTSKIDNYSYGVLMIHTLCGRWPFPADAFREDPQNPGSLTPIPEVERRGEYLQEIGLDHPLMGVIRRCLSNTPKSRPEASEILEAIEGELSSHPPVIGNKIEMLRRISAQDDTQQVESLATEVETQKRRIENLLSEIESRKEENESQRKEILSLRKQLETSKQAPEHSVGEKVALGGLNQPDSKQQSPQPPLTTTKQASPPPLPPRDKEDHVRAGIRTKTSLKWRRCADLPVKMAKPQSTVVRSKVYVGGGQVDRFVEQFLVCQYDPEKDGWQTLPACPVKWFALGQFQDRVITVGGSNSQGGVTGKVYQYVEESQRWKDTLKPMPTARQFLSIVTTQSAIIACGGTNHVDVKFATVEVFTAETTQWHTVDPLPMPCFSMTSVVINDTCYLLGGNGRTKLATKTVLYASVPSLIDRAKPDFNRKGAQHAIWKTLTPAPLVASAAASLGGYLLTLGGCDQNQASAAVHMLVPSTSSWVPMDLGDLPAPTYAATASQLGDGRSLLVCGGRDHNQRPTKSVCVGSMDV